MNKDATRCKPSHTAIVSKSSSGDIEMMFDARNSLVTPNPAFDGFFSEAIHSSTTSESHMSIFPIVNPIAFDGIGDDDESEKNASLPPPI